MDDEAHLAAVLEEQHHPEHADHPERRGGSGIGHDALRDEAGHDDNDVEDVPSVAEVVPERVAREVPDEDLGSVNREADIVQQSEDAVTREIGLDSDGDAVEQYDCHYEVLKPRFSDHAPAGGCCCIHIVPLEVGSGGHAAHAEKAEALLPPWGRRPVLIFLE